MYGDLKTQLQTELEEIRAAGLYKGERVIDTPQAARVSVGERSVLNMCANNYLGLASHPEVVDAARAVTRDERDARVDGDRAHRLIGFDDEFAGGGGGDS